MAHIILMNPELDQVETHKVDTETFLKVYDLLHPKVEDITEGMTFGQAQRAPEIMAEVLPAASDPIEDIPAFGDAMANRSFEEPEPELEPVMEMGTQHVPPKDETENNAKRRMAMNGDAAFADSLAALFR